MVYELFEKGSHMFGGIKEMQVSIGKSSMTIGKGIYKFCNKKEFIEVYLDRENNKVGLKPSKDFVKGFKIHDKKDKSNVYLTGSFIKLLPRGIYECEERDGFIVFNVSEIAKKEIK